LQAGTPLKSFPLLGFLFRTPKTKEGGTETAVRSERHFPVDEGAVLRWVVEMSKPPKARFILDTGNSGHAGHPHFADQKPLWHDGKFLTLLTARQEIEQNKEGSIQTGP
jgi:acyl-homoserine lactone acylase PvdQ